MTKPDKRLEAARAARDKALELFESMDDISGIGLTEVDGEYAIRVNLDHERDSRNPLPKDIDGVPLDVRVVGSIHKQ